MPRQNRVTPFGEVVAVPGRGTLMGNRGVLHDDAGVVRRSWSGRRWILCLTAFKGRRRVVMSPGRYTELFFLDEATGLAAGHRPCAECQRERFLAFRAASTPGEAVPADELDRRLHAARVGSGHGRQFHPASLEDLPDGVFVSVDEGRAELLWRGELLTWSAVGYRVRRPRPAGGRVSVLTPRPTVEAIAAGYLPAVHETAGETDRADPSPSGVNTATRPLERRGG